MSDGIPKVSIIIPVYNGEKVLERCLNSVLAQTYTDFELIIINDGSTDRSIDIINEYKNKDNRIKVINNKNNGVSETRNIGIEASIGEYIQFVDCDDYIESNMLSNMVDNIENAKVDLIVTGIFLDIENGNDVKRSIQTFKYENLHGKANIARGVLERLDGAYIHSLWNKIFKRDIIVKNNIKMDKNINLGEDLIFNLEYLKRCENIVFDDKCYYHYCMQATESLTARYRENKLELMKLLYDKCEEYFYYCGLKNFELLNNVFIKWMYSCFIDMNNIQCKLTIKEKIKYIKESRENYIEIINKTNNLGLMLGILKAFLRYPFLAWILSKIIYIIKVRFRQILYRG